MNRFTTSILVLALTCLFSSAQAQTINWGSLKAENKQLITVNAGLEYGAVYGIGYGYKINNRLFPIIATVEYSAPTGDKPYDDFKTKIGGQIRWVKLNNFQFSTKLHGVFRSYQNELVRMLNFGSDLSGIAGYYRPNWFVAGELGFDKAIVTHFDHSQAYREQYPGVVDGWYEPATGGNLYYGLQTGVSFRRHDISVRAGKLLRQDFKTAPMLPFYGQLGYTIRF
ncbi:hypothetical protein GCM10023189_39450 [Nibrella saemangeumensis]|uniref:Outer membrane protein beta-barrel domain-containing protein n=1 Tax=Nibrella saemangeumensis TaxID=1084526 RepID=A0ABP8N7B4_9BACT